jgi:hypothetical protein
VNIQEYQTIKTILRKAADHIETSKRPAYTIGSEDVLANFKRVGASSGMTPAQCCLVYMLKHVDSVSAFIKNPDIPQAESILGRFADLHNYVCLCLALLAEENEELIILEEGEFDDESI